MAIQEKMLNQSHPDGTSTSSVYTPATNTTAIIKNIMVCNVTGSALTFDIHVTDDGLTGGDANAIFKSAPIKANETISVDSFIAIQGDGTRDLQIRASAGNALTFSFFGAEIT